MPRSTTTDAASLESGPYSNPTTSDGLIYTSAQTESASVFTWSQLERLPSMPSIEVSAAQFLEAILEARVHSNGTLQTRLYGTMQHKSTASSGVPTYRRTARSERPSCTICGKDFGRVQELKRHTKAIHRMPSHCLFCSFKWTRPDKIRAHLKDKHPDCFSKEIWEKITALPAKQLGDFLMLFKLFRSTETTSASPVPSDPYPS